MIEDQKQLEYTIKEVAKMYVLRDQDAEEKLYSEQLREDVVESTESMIRKLEREIGVYLARKYAREIGAEQPERAA